MIIIVGVQTPGCFAMRCCQMSDAHLGVQKHGVGNWRLVADEVGIASCPAKSCCQRWKSKHQPNLITGPFSDLEDAVIIAALQVKPGTLP